MLSPLPLIHATTPPITQPTPEPSRQDGSTIARLQWTAPDNILPGTYHQYLASHPRTKATFYTPITNPPNCTYAVLVTDSLYPSIQPAVTQYLADVNREGYQTYLGTVTGGTPEQIKAWVTDRYHEGARGVLFIGDITAAWAEVNGDVFPSDLFYMDLNGTWTDTDGDGVYESHTAGTGDMAPELYVARLYATTLSYDTEANLVNGYFAKDHAYRNGSLAQTWRGLEYVEEDWFDMDVNLNNIYHDNVTRYDYGYFTTAADYLNQMDLGQHYVQVCVHSYSGGHFFSTRPTESVAYGHVYVHSPSARQAKLFLGSDDGVAVWLNGIEVYRNDRYGGWIQDQFHVAINLTAGWNRLLIKVSQDGGDFKSSVRITDPDGNSFSDLVYQVNDPATHGSDGEYIRGFLLNGFHQDVSDNFWQYLTTDYLGVNEASANPQAGDIQGGCTWTSFTSGNPYINLGSYCNQPNYGACYAFVRIYASDTTNCELRLGYDDGARVWLNGQEILYDNRYGGYTPDMTRLNVTLQSGENRLLVKVSQWMGDFGFSARFCDHDGHSIPGLSYDPQALPIAHIGTWLFDGPYVNPDKKTRLSTDYLNGEAAVTPSENDSAPFGTWLKAIGEGCPFNIGEFYDHGDWVFSSTIQERNPPVLFFNLFACGPGRFTDADYLAGAYLFNTGMVLSDVASSKSGSMLNFGDFTDPLGQGRSLGESYHLWWDRQAPYVEWEKEWYYGLVLNGDPTLCIPSSVQLQITKPDKGLYLHDHRLFSLPAPVCIGPVTVETSAVSAHAGIDKVEFYLDGMLQSTVWAEPFQWTWSTPAWLHHQLSVVAYNDQNMSTMRNLTVWKFH
jgi:hypothetical protein